MNLREFLKENKKILRGSTAFLFFLGCWEFVGATGRIDPMFTSYPTLILVEGFNMFFVTKEVYWHLGVSGMEFGIGFGGAIVVGILLGITMGRYETASNMLMPFIMAKLATPRIAFLPLFIIWFGIGLTSKVVLIFLGPIFPILVNTYEGVRTTDPRLIEAAKAYGARERDIFFKIVLNNAIPFVIAALRIGLARALISVIVAEMYAATAGLGFLISITGVTFQTSKLFVVVVIFAVSGVLITTLIRRVERWYAPWLHEMAVS